MNKLLFLAILMGCCCSALCADILNGTLITDRSFENVVTLVVEGGETLCTATLIDPKIVVTAAHCLLNNPQKIIGIYIGNGRPKGQLLATDTIYKVIKGFTYYTEWYIGPRGTVDMAILILQKPVTSIKPVNIIKDKDLVPSIFSSSQATIVGFGQRSVADQSMGLKSQGSTEIKQLDFNFGVMQVGTYHCEDCQAAIYGDSGGPVFLTSQKILYQAGIVSRGDAEFNTIMYTMIHPFLCWIESKSHINLKHNFDCSKRSEQRSSTTLGNEFNY